MNFNTFKAFLLISVLFVFGACEEEQSTAQDFTINVRLRTDPGRLNPMVGTPTSESTELNGLVFLPLANYDPVSYELSPILVEEITQGEKIAEGEFKDGFRYTYTILEDAVWDDGLPVTAEDYLFTLKVAKNPEVDAVAWRGILKNIVDVEINENNPKNFSVILDAYFHLAREITCTFEIFPKHIYDPEGVLDNYAISLLNNDEALKNTMDQDSTLTIFARKFNSNEFTQNTVSGCGPYKLKAWEIDQYIVFESKENYWGSKYPDRIPLRAYPNEITYRIIADENAAVTLLKDGSIDLMNFADATVFENMKSSTNFDSLFNLNLSPLLRYYYIGLNNRKPELNDKDIRRGLAHLFDVDAIIETLENGYAERQVSPLMPASPYYNTSLKPIPFDSQKATDIFVAEGWEDSNNNGIRDKVIDGQLVELEIDYLASQSPLGQKVGLIFQDNARAAGVKVNMIVKEGRQLQEAIYNHEYEASASAVGLSLAPYDPYQRWHSDNSVLQKGNVAGYVNDRNDELIDIIRNEEDEEIRKNAYLEFQELMYEEQPVVFLYAPVQKFVLSKRFDGLFSAKRPGYFVNAFKLSQN